jgi:hypothetical protein
MAGSNNNISVLQQLLVFARLAQDNAPSLNYEINGHHYGKQYYIADGSYPQWPHL